MTVLIRNCLIAAFMAKFEVSQKNGGVTTQIKKIEGAVWKDKEGLSKAQMQMYKSEGVNPRSGCLPEYFTGGGVVNFPFGI